MADEPSLNGPLARVDGGGELVAEFEGALKAFLAMQTHTLATQPAFPFCRKLIPDVPSEGSVVEAIPADQSGRPRPTGLQNHACWTPFEARAMADSLEPITGRS
jgi:hypothetical protein